MPRIIVGITAKFDLEGVTTPLILHWPDGRQWDITSFKELQMVAGVKAYACRIAGKSVLLHRDRDLWFINKD